MVIELLKGIITVLSFGFLAYATGTFMGWFETSEHNPFPKEQDHESDPRD